MSSNVEGAEPPFVFRPIPGGNSNLTYRVRGSNGREFALRRPPMGRILESAHDMAREYRLISALQGSRVPVPRALGVCSDPGVNDAPFYVMGFVDGVVLHDRDAGGLIPPGDRPSVANSAVKVLANLHLLDPDEIGLGDLGRRDGYLHRQLYRWARQLEASKQRDLPAMDRARALLEDRVPRQQRASVVHGDYRLGNLIVDGGRVRAGGGLGALHPGGSPCRSRLSGARLDRSRRTVAVAVLCHPGRGIPAPRRDGGHVHASHRG